MMFKLGVRAGAVLAAVATAACSGGTGGPQKNDGPTWSLADKKPQALGVFPSSSPQADPANPTANSGRTYEYRGGRDPVTGQARTLEGPKAGATDGQARRVPPAQERQTHTVEVHKGDTLHGLSLQHHVSVDALMAANNLTTTKIVAGQKLVLPPQL